MHQRRHHAGLLHGGRAGQGSKGFSFLYQRRHHACPLQKGTPRPAVRRRGSSGFIFSPVLAPAVESRPRLLRRACPPSHVPPTDPIRSPAQRRPTPGQHQTRRHDDAVRGSCLRYRRPTPVSTQAPTRYCRMGADCRLIVAWTLSAAASAALTWTHQCPRNTLTRCVQ